LNGVGRLALDARQAPEEKQRDGNDANLVMLGHNAVGKLMEQNRGEKEQAGQDANGPMLCVCPKRMLLLVLRSDDIGDGYKNENPSRMQIDGNAENFADA